MNHRVRGPAAGIGTALLGAASASAQSLRDVVVGGDHGIVVITLDGFGVKAPVGIGIPSNGGSIIGHEDIPVATTASGLDGIGATGQDDIVVIIDMGMATAGNGGLATGAANGGAVAIGDVNSGGNAGNAIGIGDTPAGAVSVDGGLVSNVTDLDVSATGGTAIADASGGNYNLAFVS